MKLVRIYTGEDGASHIEQRELALTENDGLRTDVETATGIVFATRPEGSFIDFHPAPRRQYVLYLTCSVEIGGLADGSTMVMEPGDVLRAEDTTGRGHTSRVLRGGVCAFIRLED